MFGVSPRGAQRDFAHHLVGLIIYHLITEKKEYEELGGDYLDPLDRQGKEQRLIHQLENLGFEVSLTPTD